MSFFDRLIPGGSQERNNELRDRVRGKNSQAVLGLSQARGRNASAAASTAARAADGAMTPAAAQRLASQQRQAADAQSGQAFAQQRSAEVQRAEAELARNREQRSAFGRQLFGSALSGAGAIAGQLGIGAPGQGGPGAPGGGSPMQGAAAAAGTALGGPVGGAAGSAFGRMLFGGEASPLAAGRQPEGAAGLSAPPAPAQPSAIGQVDQALTAFDARAQPQAAATPGSIVPKASDGDLFQQRLFGGAQGLPEGMTPQQYADWLRLNGGAA